MSDIGEKIRILREDRGLSRKAFGDLTGLSEAKVQALEIGKQRVDHEALFNITTSLGVDANWLLGVSLNPTSCLIDDDHDVVSRFVPIPRFSVSASAGNGALVETEEATGAYAFNVKWLSRRQLDPRSLAVISVRGDSMEPRLADGDLILVDRAQQDIADGTAFVLRLGSELLVKYVQRVAPSVISLISENRRYPPRELDLAMFGENDVQIIGRVVASMHEW